MVVEQGGNLRLVCRAADRKTVLSQTLLRGVPNPTGEHCAAGGFRVSGGKQLSTSGRDLRLDRNGRGGSRAPAENVGFDWRKPDWGWSVQYGQRDNFSDLLSVRVSIDLPLNRTNLQNRRVTEASELAAAARDRLEDVRRELKAQFEEAWARWSAANVRYSTNLNQTLPALEAAENALLARLAGGQPALAEVQAASERTTRTALDVVDQRAALARTSADLSFYLEDCVS